MKTYCESCRLLRPDAEDEICPQCGDFLVEEPAKTKPMASKKHPDPFEYEATEGAAKDDTEPLPVSPTTSSIHTLFKVGDTSRASSPASASRGGDDGTLKAGEPSGTHTALPGTETASSGSDLDQALPAAPPILAKTPPSILPPVPRPELDETDLEDDGDGTQFDVDREWREADDTARATVAPPSPRPPSVSMESRPRPASSVEPQRGAGPESVEDDDVSRRIAERVKAGYAPFGFVGYPASGKTHFLKALQTLLETHGVAGDKAADELDGAFLPAASQARVSVYPFASDYGKWLFMDAGGELYTGIKANNWSSFADQKLELTAWLHRCKGLFLFLHVQRAHLDLETVHSRPGDADRKALEARQELRFFGQFLLFMRAVAAENGDVKKIVDLCRKTDDVQDALRTYDQTAPKLKIPVMLFMTKADSYGPGFEIAEGVHFVPGKMPVDPMAFTARHLPTVFRSLLENVLRFKVDFLQSYVEFPAVDAYGNPLLENDGRTKTKVRWQASPQEPLSVGLTPALEFILRHPPEDVRGDWRDLLRGHGLDTRQALWLHRKLNAEAWNGVKIDLRPPSRRRKTGSRA